MIRLISLLTITFLSFTSIAQKELTPEILEENIYKIKLTPFMLRFEETNNEDLISYYSALLGETSDEPLENGMAKSPYLLVFDHSVTNLVGLNEKGNVLKEVKLDFWIVNGITKKVISKYNLKYENAMANDNEAILEAILNVGASGEEFREFISLGKTTILKDLIQNSDEFFESCNASIAENPAMVLASVFDFPSEFIQDTETPNRLSTESFDILKNQELQKLESDLSVLTKQKNESSVLREICEKIILFEQGAPIIEQIASDSDILPENAKILLEVKAGKTYEEASDNRELMNYLLFVPEMDYLNFCFGFREKNGWLFGLVK